ncbi:MAG: indole-3-glycerol phosphate synthase TrpC [Candidatus Omnitrophota bacterium]
MLSSIIAGVRTGARERARKKPLVILENEIAGLPEPRNFTAALSAKKRLRIIAEIKRASPSAGLLRPELSPGALAQSYQEAGATAISVLTEKDHFRGSLADLAVVRKSINIPILQKDFILLPYQIYEARANGADAVLLIVALHNRQTLQELFSLALSLKLSALVEIHSETELADALSIGAEIIGINNRNLATLQTDLNVSRRILPLIPKEKIKIVESGLKTKTEIRELSRRGASAFLVGESLLRQENPAVALASLLNTSI